MLLIQNIDLMQQQMLQTSVADSIREGIFAFSKTSFGLHNDTLSSAISVVNKPAIGHFIQQSEVTFNIVNHFKDYSGWITLYILGLSFILALIWYFFPERVLRILSREGSKHKLKYTDNQFAKPGIFLYALYIITFISTMGIFFYLLIKFYSPELFINYPFQKIVFGILILIILYFFIRLLIIFLFSFLFQTHDLMLRQRNANFRIDLTQSLILLPILIIMLNYSTPFIYYSGIVLLAYVVAFKWGVTIVIGIKSSKISLYHNILYLCALEITPVIVLVKLLENYGLVFITN